ncbi:TetR/AcrR family transcriptional regulator [Nocardia sp. IBHARD005]|uniref:TetR/AcrR family transcriptional regulator n=1 Tax=Nocardia sp. IBHARD005 TaxID=3457765 RepID=UPI0040594B05
MSAPRRAQAIYAATLDQLAEHGYEGMTIEGIAVAAGVNKTTIYRWWPGKDALLGAAVREGRATEFPDTDTGTLRGDLIAALAGIARILETEIGRQLVAGTVMRGNPEITAVAREFLADRLRREQVILDRAHDRGELREHIAAHQFFYPAIGALWVKVLALGEPATTEYLHRLVEDLLTGITGDEEVRPSRLRQS